MKKAKLTLHPDYRIGDISPRLFGAFLETIGSMVNGSMYNPRHPSADEQGMRKDFYTALKEAGLPAVRMPGGNFVSGWQWKDSIFHDKKGAGTETAGLFLHISVPFTDPRPGMFSKRPAGFRQADKHPL